MRRAKLVGAGVIALALTTSNVASGPALAQEAAATDSGQGQDIVVTAQKSGAPMWVVESGGTRLLLVGEIAEVPKSTPWRPERLEGATERAQRVILGTKAKVSPGDVFRLLFSGGKLRKLPGKTTVADYLDPARQRRLAALMPKGEDYRRTNLLIIAFDLLTKRLRFNRDTGDDATDVVRRAARAAKVPTRPVGTVRGKDLLDTLFQAPPASHIPCLDAAMAAAELGPSSVQLRGQDWTRFAVTDVMNSPIENAIDRCWPWGDTSTAGEIRRQWDGAIATASREQGATLAVVPLRLLAERGGILDQLTARGLDPRGPKWRR